MIKVICIKKRLGDSLTVGEEYLAESRGDYYCIIKNVEESVGEFYDKSQFVIKEDKKIKEKYKLLINRFVNIIKYDLNYLRDTWAYKYYEKPYEKYLSVCNELLNNDYELKISKENAEKIFNNINKEIDFIFKNENPLLNDGQEFNYRINIIAINVELIKSINRRLDKCQNLN